MSVSKKDYTITIEDQEKEEDRSMNWFSNKVNNPHSPNKMKSLSPKNKLHNNNKVFTTLEIKRTISSEKIPENPLLPSFKRQTSSPLIQIPQNNNNNDPFSLNPGSKEKVSFKSFKIIKVLGSGAFGKVFLVLNFFIFLIHKINNNVYKLVGGGLYVFIKFVIIFVFCWIQ